MENIANLIKQPCASDIFDEYGLDKNNIPKHIAIIMDGNGRWAKKRLMPRAIGHRQGAESLRRALKTCVKLGVKYLSVYTFSTENWKRPPKEVALLMSLFKTLISQELPELNKQGVRVKCLGDREGLSDDVLAAISNIEEKTKTNTVIQLNLLFNYGSRREISLACKALAEDYKKGYIKEISEDVLSQYLLTHECPDPDILIRTGGDYRISNYMLWQLSYAEFFFLDRLWPDFDQKDLCDVISSFQNRDRRFGGVD